MIPGPNRERLLLAAILVLAAALRVWGLAAESFWHDEAWTWGLIQDGPRALLYRLARFDAHPPFYFLVLQAWSFFGESEAWLRLPSAILGVAALPLLYRLVSRLADARAGTIAMLLLAVSPYHVYYSREARSYALLFFLCLASLNLLFDLLAAPSRNRRIALAAVTAAIVLTHYLGALFVIGEAVALLILRRGGKDFAIAMAGAFVLFLPWLLPFLDHLRAVSAGFWLPKPTGQIVLFSMCELVVNPHVFGGRSGYFLSLPFYAAAIALPALTRRREWIALAALIGVPVVLELLFSLRSPIFYAQTFQYVLIPLFALAAVAVARLPGRRVIAGALILALAMVPGLVQLHRAPRKENWRDATAWMNRSVRPDDLVVVQPGFVGINLEYYARHEPWRRQVRLIGNADMRRDGVPRETALREVREKAAGVWVVFRYGQDEGWFEALNDAFERRSSFSSRGADAHYFQRRTSR